MPGDHQVEDDLVAQEPRGGDAAEGHQVGVVDLHEAVELQVVDHPAALGSDARQQHQVEGQRHEVQRVDPQEPAPPEGSGVGLPGALEVRHDERPVQRVGRHHEEDRHDDADEVDHPGEREDPGGEERVPHHDDDGAEARGSR
jgi:hypothetical protein